MNERVQLRYCVVDCLKHDISSHGVKSVFKVQFHKDLVPRHARNEASGSVNRRFTAACCRDAHLERGEGGLQFGDGEFICTLRRQPSPDVSDRFRSLEITIMITITIYC